MASINNNQVAVKRPIVTTLSSTTVQVSTTSASDSKMQINELQQEFIKGNISGEEFKAQAKELGYKVTLNTNAKTINEKIQIEKMQVNSASVSSTVSLVALKTKVDCLIDFAGSSKCTFTGKSVGKRYLTQLSNEYQKALNKIQNSKLSDNEIKALFDDLATKSKSTFKSTAVKSVEKEYNEKKAQDTILTSSFRERFERNLRFFQGGVNAEDLFYLYDGNESGAVVHVALAGIFAAFGVEF